MYIFRIHYNDTYLLLSPNVCEDKILVEKGVLKGPCNEIVCFRVFMNQLLPWHLIKSEMVQF
jgi:hypothetical protein